MTPSTCWLAGWCAILAGFVAGAVPGLFFAGEEWLGGYGAWRRRLLRLAHISLVALGMLDLLCALGMHAGFTAAQPARAQVAASLLVTGTVAMPAVCFLAAWRRAFRHAFALPVVALASGVALLVASGGGR